MLLRFLKTQINFYKERWKVILKYYFLLAKLGKLLEGYHQGFPWWLRICLTIQEMQVQSLV